MTSETTRRLRDALKACDIIESYTVGLNASMFASAYQTQDAVAYRLAVLGEALNALARAEPSAIHRVPELRRIVALRNRVIHAYDDVDDQIGWTIVSEELPKLQDQLRRFKEQLG
jgi:uncharacterized protein with HEPN domain